MASVHRQIQRRPGSGISFQPEEKRRENGKEFLAILNIARDNLSQLVNVINYTTDDFHQIPSFKKLDKIFDVFSSRRHEAEVQIKGASRRLIDALVVIHAKVNDQQIIKRVEVLGHLVKGILEAWGTFFEATDDLVKNATELQMRVAIGNRIKFLHGVASRRMAMYFDNIEKLIAELIICGEYCTYKTSEQIRNSVESSREFFYMPSQRLRKTLALQHKPKAQQQPRTTLPQVNIVPGRAKSSAPDTGVKPRILASSHTASKARSAAEKSNTSGKASAIKRAFVDTDRCATPDLSSSYKPAQIVNEGRKVVNQKHISIASECSKKASVQGEPFPKTSTTKRKFADTDACSTSDVIHSSKRAKIVNVGCKVDTPKHRPISSGCAEQTSMQKSAPNRCNESVSLQKPKITSEFNHKRTHVLQHGKIKQTVDRKTKQTKQLNIPGTVNDKRPSTASDKLRPVHTVKFIPLDIFGPISFDKKKTIKPKRIKSSKQIHPIKDYLY